MEKAVEIYYLSQDIVVVVNWLHLFPGKKAKYEIFIAYILAMKKI